MRLTRTAGCGDASGSCDANAGCSAGVEGGARRRSRTRDVATGDGNTACGAAGGSGGGGDRVGGFGVLGGSTGSGGRGAAPAPCGAG